MEYHQDSVLTFSLLAIPAGPTSLLLHSWGIPSSSSSFFVSQPLGLGRFLPSSILVEGNLGFSHWWEIVPPFPSESRRKRAAVPLTLSDLPFPSLPVAWLFLPWGSHHEQLPMCCCDLSSGSRKQLTILRLVSHHISWSLAPYYIQMHKQLACQEHAWCFVKPYHWGGLVAGLPGAAFGKGIRRKGRLSTCGASASWDGLASGNCLSTQR